MAGRAKKRRGTPGKKPVFELPSRMRVDMYAARQYLRLGTIEDAGLRIPAKVYFKDPDVAAEFEGAGFDPDFTTPWEPGLRDGPTSARFAVVDYDSTRNVLTPPAIWDRNKNCYCTLDSQPLTGDMKDLFQYHQLSVWANIQNTLDFFESGTALG